MGREGTKQKKPCFQVSSPTIARLRCASLIQRVSGTKCQGGWCVGGHGGLSLSNIAHRAFTRRRGSSFMTEW